ncbi:MAG: hypothetical protein IPL89_18055 [Acidobacteria bacterium]|nr:hypothetical protein [Acidobacteriota bacterium]
MFLRSAGWGFWSYWLDEAIQAVISRQELAKLFASLRADAAHPPLAYLLTWAIERAGGGEAALRGASAAASVAAVFFVFRRAGGFARAAAAFGAAAVFAVLPASVHYGQEVRPYALALACVAGADLALDAARRGVRGAGIAHVVFAAASVATLYFALFPLVALWADAAWRARREGRRFPACAAAALAVSAGFLAAWFLWIGPRPPSPVAPGGLLRHLPGILSGLVTFRESSLEWPVLAAILWAVALLGVAAAGRERPRLALLLAATLGGPVLVLGALGWFVALRYFLFALLPLSWGIGEALARVRPGALRAAAGFLLLAPLAPAVANVVREGRPDWRSVSRGIETAHAAGLAGDVVAADGWSYWALSAQWPAGPGVRLADGEAALGEAIGAGRPLWVVRTPHHPGPPAVDARLTAPWWRATAAEDTAVYRFESGRAVEPGAHVWSFFGGGVRFPKGGGVASRDMIETFSKDVTILASEGPWADGSVTATVRLTDDLGSAHNWVGVAARRSGPADGFRDSGVLGLLRGNGEAVLFWPGGEKKAATGADPRRGPVRLALVCRGPRVAFLVEGREVAALEDAPAAPGWAGVHAWGLARVTELRIDGTGVPREGREPPKTGRSAQK